jgi:hypothetical protein
MSLFEAQRTEEEVDELANLAFEIKDEIGSRYPGMSYEDGITNTIDWLRGHSDNPLEEN